MSEKIVSDGFGNEWLRCERSDCDLSVVRPGRVQCKCEFECPCGGQITYHFDPDLRWSNVTGWFCSACGPFPVVKEKR